MKKLYLGILMAACVFTLGAQAELFSPGNVIFADPFYSPDGQIVELKITGNEAEVINVVRWDLADTLRRRALGLDVDPNGTVFVGITATWENNPENPYPEGIGEVLRIDKQGNQTFYMTDIVKTTYLSAIGVDEVVVSSNVASDQHLAYRYKFSGTETSEWSEYNKGSHGEALRLPDGRLLFGDNTKSGIHIYDLAGGEPTGVFYDDGRTVRSLSYNDKIGAVIASLQDQRTILRIGLDGVLQEEYNATNDGFTAIWGIAQIPGTTNFITGNHDVAGMASVLGVFNALDLAAGPRLITITSGFANAGLPEGTTFRSFFNMAVVPGAEFPPSVDAWSLF
ncbi:MAG: hypothetical protein RBU29_03185 [bacterium]|jgi:hypothetical protein|nr:hypothetical protein [bacterium]